jgi:hypothetical protein
MKFTQKHYLRSVFITIKINFKKVKILTGMMITKADFPQRKNLDFQTRTKLNKMSKVKNLLHSLLVTFITNLFVNVLF